MTVAEQCKLAKIASTNFNLTTEQKNALLKDISARIEAMCDEIIFANHKDVASAREREESHAFIDRLTLNKARVTQMYEGVATVASLPDPVGEVTEDYLVPSGLHIKKVRAPMGVIGIIFEARPNVAVDAVALCLKSGNAVVLRGSRDSAQSVAELVKLLKGSLSDMGVDPNLVINIEGGHESAEEMLSLGDCIDVVIPRGGDGLKNFVLQHAKMPVIASGGGNCHTYVASSADQERAIKVILNAKTSRPATCNALETLLIDKKILMEFAPKVIEALVDAKVEVRGDAEIKKLVPTVTLCDEAEYFKEYDDLIIKVKAVDGVAEAINHINKYGSHHSDAIITATSEEGELFTKAVDSAAVYINASTRFTDGFEFGLGAEMGISTQRLHVRGPIGLRDLTQTKYVVHGDYTERR